MGDKFCYRCYETSDKSGLLCAVHTQEAIEKATAAAANDLATLRREHQRSNEAWTKVAVNLAELVKIANDELRDASVTWRSPLGPMLDGLRRCAACGVMWTIWGPSAVQPHGSMSAHGATCDACEQAQPDSVVLERVEIADLIAERNAAIERAQMAESMADNADKMAIIMRSNAEIRAKDAERSREDLKIKISAISDEVVRLRIVLDSARLVYIAHNRGWDLKEPIAHMSAAIDRVENHHADEKPTEKDEGAMARSFDFVLGLAAKPENAPGEPTVIEEEPVRIDLANVTRKCVACGGNVITTQNRTPVCAACRAKGLCGADELKEAMTSEANENSEMLNQARLAVDWMCEARKAQAELEIVRSKHDALRAEIVVAMTSVGEYMSAGDDDPFATGEVSSRIHRLREKIEPVATDRAAAVIRNALRGNRIEYAHDGLNEAANKICDLVAEKRVPSLGSIRYTAESDHARLTSEVIRLRDEVKSLKEKINQIERDIVSLVGV